MASLAIAGLRGTGDWGTDERPKNFREQILFRNPEGSAPIFALMSRVQKESTDDPEYSWWDEPNDIVRLEVAGALGTTDTEVVVDSIDPDATSANKDKTYGTATHLKPGDLLLVEPATDNATYDHEIIRVESVASVTSFTVSRGASGTTAAAIGDGLFLFKLGSSYSEGTAEAEAVSRNPIKYSNFTEIFKTTYEVTGTAAKTRARTGDLLANERKRKMFDHSKAIELALLFGVKSEVTGSNGKPQRTTDGLRIATPGKTTTILTTNWDMANAASSNNLLEAVSPVFDWESSAGTTRMAFAGNNALNRMNQAAMTNTNAGATTVNFNGGTTVFGMQFQKLEFPQGTLLIKSHPLLSRNALYKNSMFIIDFSALRYRPMRGRDTKFQDNIQAKGEDVVRGQWITEAGFEVRMGGLSCGYIGGFDAAIA